MDPAQIYRQHPLRNPPPPTAPPEMPPFLERPQQGRSDGRSPPHVDSWRPPQHDFTFRNNPSAPQFPRETDRYGPASDPRRRNNNRRGYAQNNRGRAFRRPTAERPLLSSKRGLSPEDVLGQTDAQNAAHRFLPADDVSDSEEEEMEESDDEQQPTTYGHQGVAPSASTDGVVKTSDLHGASEASGPPTKRRATAVKDTEEAASVPKWSNPDPYTVLPPVDETQRKRKDVVKIIRKARITAEKELASENQVAANDDFISFGLEVENDSDEESPPTTPEPGIPGAPTGPRAFSHLDNLRGAAPDRAPGASTQRPSANELGPPPDLRDTYPMRSGRQVSRVDLYPEQAEALGNRKRTFEDDIKGDVVPGAKKRKKIPASTGSVLPQWMTREDTDSTPWLAGDHRSTESLGFRYVEC